MHEYWDYKRYIKAFVIVGTIIASYSLFSFFTDTNIIRVLPSSFQHVSEYHFRTSGFSQEPGCYVLYQSWVVLFSIYIRDCFSPKKGYWIIAINILALILTLSSLLIVWCVLIIISPFIFKMSLKSKVRVAIIVGMVLQLSIFYILVRVLSNNRNYFVNKINNFLTDHGANTRIIQGYGMSESLAAIALGFKNIVKKGYIGVPFPGCYIGIFSPDDKEVPYGTEGEILC